MTGTGTDGFALNDEAVLRRKVHHPVEHLDVIELDTTGLAEVTFECGEVVSMCPITNQPDLSAVNIRYVPNGGLIESKSLKLYLWGFRDRGVFCEVMAQEIARRVLDDAAPLTVEVEVVQSIRGGIVTRAVALLQHGD